MLFTRATITGTEPKERFTGKERDVETGLDYFGARYYMPAVGRWGSVDPILNEKPPLELLKIRNGQLFAFTPYNYAFDDSATLTDPDGKCRDCFLDVISIVLNAKDLYENPTWTMWDGSPQMLSQPTCP